MKTAILSFDNNSKSYLFLEENLIKHVASFLKFPEITLAGLNKAFKSFAQRSLAPSEMYRLKFGNEIGTNWPINDEIWMRNLTQKEFNDPLQIGEQLFVRVQFLEGYEETFVEDSWKLKAAIRYYDLVEENLKSLSEYILLGMLVVFSRIEGQEDRFIRIFACASHLSPYGMDNNLTPYGWDFCRLKPKDLIRIAQLNRNNEEILATLYTDLPHKYAVLSYCHAAGITMKAEFFNEWPFLRSFSYEFNADCSFMYNYNRNIIQSKGLANVFNILNEIRYGSAYSLRNDNDELQSFYNTGPYWNDKDLLRRIYFSAAYIGKNFDIFRQWFWERDADKLGDEFAEMLLLNPESIHEIPAIRFSPYAFAKFFALVAQRGLLRKKPVYDWFYENRHKTPLTFYLSQSLEEYSRIVKRNDMTNCNYLHALEYIFATQKGKDQMEYLKVFLDNFDESKVFITGDTEIVDRIVLNLCTLLPFASHQNFAPLLNNLATIQSRIKIAHNFPELFKFFVEMDQVMPNHPLIYAKCHSKMLRPQELLFSVRHAKDFTRFLSFFRKEKDCLKLIESYGRHNSAVLRASMMPSLLYFLKQDIFLGFKHIPIPLLSELIAWNGDLIADYLKSKSELEFNEFKEQTSHFEKRNDLHEVKEMTIKLEPLSPHYSYQVWNLFYLMNGLNYQLKVIDPACPVFSLNSCPHPIFPNSPLKITCQVCKRTVNTELKRQNYHNIAADAMKSDWEHYCPECKTLLASI